MSDFSNKVDRYLRDDDLEIKVDRLAKEFGVSMTDVCKWADGDRVPAVQLQRKVMRWIDSQSWSQS